MRSEKYLSSQKRDDEPVARTFIEQARRVQLVDAAIAVLADVGYERASLARIAAAAGVSKGVVSYHFDSKEELLGEVVGRVSNEAKGFMVSRIVGETTAVGRLKAYIRGNVSFMAVNRAGLKALVEVVVHTPMPNPYATYHEAGLAELEGVLTAGQLAGEFGSFSPPVMAMAVRASIDGIPGWLAREPELDLDVVGDDLAELFGRAASAS